MKLNKFYNPRQLALPKLQRKRELVREIEEKEEEIAEILSNIRKLL